MQGRFVVIGLVAVNVLILTLYFLSNTTVESSNLLKERNVHDSPHEDFHQHEDIIKLIESIDYPKPPQNKIRVISILGTRPEVIKFALLLRHFRTRPEIESILVTTGQQREMEEQQMRFFGLKPDLNLDLMKPNQTVTQVTAEVIFLLGKAFAKLQPHLVLVQGDTTTAMAASIAAFYNKIPVGHIEAGLRTMNIYSPFPEEMHRRVIGVVTLFHFAPTELAASRLIDEGFSKNKISITGNTGIDSFLWAIKQKPSAKVNQLISKYKLDNPSIRTILMTAHRRENFGNGMENICRAIRKIADSYSNVQVLFPVHLNPNVRKPVNEILKGSSNIHLIEPLAYDELVHVMKRAYFIMTDSGGIQEEAVAAGKPLLLIRENTERLEGVLAGVVKMVGTSVEPIVTEAKKLLTDDAYYTLLTKPAFPYGYGNASEIITNIIIDHSERLRSRQWAMELEEQFAKDAQDAVLQGKYGYSWSKNKGKNDEEEQNDSDLVKLDIKGRNPTVQSEFCKSFEPMPLQKYQTLHDLTLPTLSYDKLMQLPSKYKPGDHAFNYTLIVGAWRRPQYIARILDSYAAQTHPPQEMWVSIFASPKETEYKEVLLPYKEKSKIPVKLIFGDPQLSYWARFQLGLQVNTPYLAILDDDCIPGTKFAAGVLQMMNTEDYRGIYGIKGFIDGGMQLAPTKIWLTDVIGGVWFMESKWLKVLFRETPLTWLTGEDYQFAYAARKYLNIPSFVAPWNPPDKETRGISDDYMSVSNAGDTTLFIHDGRAGKRWEIIDFHRRRGYARAGMNRQLVSVMVIVETEEQADRLSSVFNILNQEPSKSQVYPAILTSGQALGNQSAILSRFGFTGTNHQTLDMMLATEMLEHERRAIDLQAEALYAATQIFDYLRVHAIIGILSDTKSLVGVVTAAEDLNIPFVGLSPKEGEIPTLKTSTEKFLHVAARKLCLTAECAAKSALAIAQDECKWE